MKTQKTDLKEMTGVLETGDVSVSATLNAKSGLTQMTGVTSDAPVVKVNPESGDKQKESEDVVMK